MASAATERGKKNVMNKSLAKHIGFSSFAKSYMKKKEKVMSPILSTIVYLTMMGIWNIIRNFKNLKSWKAI